MNPVYKRFFDIEDSVKANRLENRERDAIKNMDNDIAKTTLLAKGFRESGQKQSEWKQRLYSPMVAETHEYQYNADAFEASGVH